MPVNVKLLKKVRKLIAEEPRRLDMGKWGARISALGKADLPKDPPPCGTVACLAGWTILASFQKKQWDELFKYEDVTPGTEAAFAWHFGTNVPGKAAELLGIPERDCPFWGTRMGVPEVLAWIDRQIDAASK